MPIGKELLTETAPLQLQTQKKENISVAVSALGKNAVKSVCMLHQSINESRARRRTNYKVQVLVKYIK